MRRLAAIIFLLGTDVTYSQATLPNCSDAGGLVDIPGLGAPEFRFASSSLTEGQAIHLSASNWLKELIVWEQTQVYSTGGRIEVKLHYRIPSGPEDIAPESFDIYLGAFPLGEYPVRVVLGTHDVNSGGPTDPSDCVVTEITMSILPAPNTPLRYYRSFGDSEALTLARSPRSVSGAWYNPAQSGFGLSLVESASRDMVSGALYAYDSENIPVWILMAGTGWTSPWDVGFDLYRFRGNGLIAPYVIPVPTLVGHGTIHFDGVSQAVFRGEWDDVEFETPIELLAK